MTAGKGVGKSWRFVWVVCLMLAAQVAAEELLNFKDSDQQQRYYALIEELRCPQCQNQNLEDSDSPIAQDLRDTVYRLLQEGKSDQEIVAYMIQRYGDFITYLPPVQRSTMLLWLMPLVLLVVGIAVLMMVRRQRTVDVSGQLDTKERSQLNTLLNEDADRGDKQ